MHTPEAQIAQGQPTHVAETVHNLRTDYVIECATIAVLKLRHFIDNVEIQDFLNADRDLRLGIQYLRESSRSYRELRQEVQP